MKKLLCALVLLSAPLTVCAQLILCERVLTTLSAQPYARPAGLLPLRPDSLRLLVDYLPISPSTSRPGIVGFCRMTADGCDTLSGGPRLARATAPNLNSLARVLPRQQVLVATPRLSGPAFDTVGIRVQLLDRFGRPRWTRDVAARGAYEFATGLLEAPDGGAYVCGADFLVRLDSLGRVRWRRTYPRAGGSWLRSPVYTRTGTLLLYTEHFVSAPAVVSTAGVMEVTQNGDSLTYRRVTPDPLQMNQSTYTSNEDVLVPLRDGGFALVGLVDSAATGYFRPFLARLDRHLAVLWTSTYRPPTAQGFYFTHPCELADGTLAVLANSGRSGRSLPYWLFRFSATGGLQPRYAFASQALPADVNSFTGTFGRVQGLQPLPDSSFVLVSTFINGPGTRLTYLAHLRVPGLPRVLDAHYVPVATPLAAQPRRVVGAGLELYPNPAGEQVMVRYAGAPPATLVLTDLLGRRVYVGALSPVETQISLSALTPGLYQAMVWAKGKLLATGRLAVVR